MQFKQVSPHETSLTSNNFIKLNDKDSIKGVFRGDPFDFKQHFIKAENKSYNCVGIGCEWCAQGERPKFRFRINFITKGPDGQYVAKIFEHGVRFYEALKTLHESGYDLEKNVMSITRNGKGASDTTYTILPVPNGAVTELLEKSLMAVSLNDLTNFKKTQKEPGEDGDDHSSDIPF